MSLKRYADGTPISRYHRTSNANTPTGLGRSLVKAGIKAAMKYPKQTANAAKFLGRKFKSTSWPLKNKNKKKVKPTINESIHSGVMEVSNGGTFTVYKKSKRSSGAGSFRYQDTNAKGVFCTPGYQGFGIIACVGSSSQILTSTGGGYTDVQSYTSYFNLNPNQHITGSTLYDKYFEAVDNEKIIFDHVLLEICSTNFTSIGVSVELYVLCCKSPTNFTPYDLWADATSSSGYRKEFPQDAPSVVGAPTGSTVTAPNIGFGRADLYGCSPMENPNVRASYRLLGKKKLVYSGGGTINTVLRINCNRLIKKETLTGVNASSFHKGTVFVLAVSRGQVVLDEADSKHIPTYGPTEVGFVVTKRHQFRSVKRAADRVRTSAFVDNITVPISADVRAINVVDAEAAPNIA